MAENENSEKIESQKKSFINIKTIMIIVPILLVQIVFAVILMNKVVKPKLQYAANDSEVEKPEEENAGEIYLVKDIIVNPKKTLGRRFINVSIGLECKDGSTFSKLEKNEIKVRDYFITLFSNCTFDELDDSADKDLLRKKIKTTINKMIAKKGIQAVYFTNFILQ